MENFSIEIALARDCFAQFIVSYLPLYPIYNRFIPKRKTNV